MKVTGQVICSSLLFLFSGGIQAQGAPVAMFTQGWIIDTSLTNSSGGGSTSQAFGFTGTPGEAVDKASETPAEAFTLATTDGIGSANAQILFSRDFSLSGSPFGWRVSLDGLLDYELTADGNSTTADVGNEFRITDAPFTSTLLSLHSPVIYTDLITTGTKTVTGAASLFTEVSVILPDGNYEVRGALRTGATGSSIFSDATADAFNSPRRFFGVVDAKPLPEPGGLLLFAVGLIWIAFFRRRRLWDSKRA